MAHHLHQDVLIKTAMKCSLEIVFVLSTTSRVCEEFQCIFGNKVFLHECQEELADVFALQVMQNSLRKRSKEESAASWACHSAVSHWNAFLVIKNIKRDEMVESYEVKWHEILQKKKGFPGVCMAWLSMTEFTEWTMFSGLSYFWFL